MMNMINANFTKQDGQNASVNDAAEKDAKSDDFGTLINGLCMTPKSDAPVPTKEKPAEACDIEGRMSGDRANLGSVKFNDSNGPKNPVFPQMAEPIAQNLKIAKSAGPLAAESPAAGVGTGIAQQLNRIKDVKFLPPNGADGDKMAPQEIKPLIKDLKTQADKFEEVTAADAAVAPIKIAKSFAEMTQEKAEAIKLGVKTLAALNAQIQIEDPGVLSGDTEVIPQEPTHFDHNYVADPVKITEFVRDRSQRKLSKLISDVTAATGVGADDGASVLHNDAVAQTEEVAAPKMSSMLEQIKPAVIQLAAAALNEGKQVLKMRLHPAELGTVEIRLEKNESGVLEAHFKADTEAAKHFLTQGLDSLRHALQNAGWQVGRMEISSSPFSSTNGSDGSAQKDAGQRNETSTPGRNSQELDPASTRSGDSSNPSADRLVSLRA